MSFLIRILFLLAAWPATQAAIASAAGGFCATPALGAPCATGGVATLGSTEPTPGLGLGNPVHLATGNKYQLDIDLPPNASAPGLELIRHYNGLSTRHGALGRNWTLSYDTELQHNAQGWQLRQADGSIQRISAALPTRDGHTWAAPDGRRLHFDAQGRLLAVSTDKTHLIRILRHRGPHPLAGLIHRVEAPNGHALSFHYAQQHGQWLLQAADTPLGRFEYFYDAPLAAESRHTLRLEAVQRPDGMRRLYHYEAMLQAGNPYALTGISLAAGETAPYRLATWEYDRHARVIRMQQHGRRLPELQLEYRRLLRDPAIGITRVRSANGAQGEIRFRQNDDGYRLLSRSLLAPESTPDTLEYDDKGRLTGMRDLQLQRTPQGAPKGVVPHAPGWPGLVLELQDEPALYTWRSNATGRTTLQADAAGRPALLQYANGDSLQLQYDAQGRPRQLEHSAAPAGARSLTRLQWRSRQPTRIEHPEETEIRQYDEQGHMLARTLQRPATPGSAAVRFQESFQHDARGRLLRHSLPEGGSLHYAWHDEGRNQRLAALLWHDAQGNIRPVLTSADASPGYRYGNGLELRSAALHSPHADTLLLTHDTATLWQQQRRYDALGRLLEDRHSFPAAAHHEQLHLAHDAKSRMQGALLSTPEGETRLWYAWQADGSLAAWRQNHQTSAGMLQRDASGLPVALNGLQLHYSPGRRLQHVTQADTGRIVAQYHHNAFGHRVVKQAAGITTHFLYLENRLVAEAQSPAEGAPPRITRRYLYAGPAPVGMILYPPDAPPQLYAVHADLSGAPRMLTDAQQRLRWLAGYTPTGQARRIAGDMDFPLRWPGQYEDQETGWHDNLLRTYVPYLGQYLEPDPLGPLPHTDTFGYARQQGWRYADPLGLLLFAFDGTRYSADTRSNAWLLAQAYNDGSAHYHSGPGNSLFLDWDAVVAWNAGRILENQWQALLTSLERQPAGVTVPVDIIGFSRGAALARHFGNRIAGHVQNGLFSVDDPLRGRVTACVDLRFMGLFDTVTQFGIAGSHNHLYDFGIAEIWSWVSHAVALHEHRWAFPLTSADAGGAGNVVEAPFVGAHSDIGGGLALLAPSAAAEDAPEESDLAQVALAWMHWQALAASVDFNPLEETDSTVQTPLLRDMRGAVARSLLRGDRALAAPSGATRQAYQDDDPRLGRAARDQTEAFIARVQDWRTQDSQTVGVVDMEGYSRWLEETLGWSPP